MILHPFRVIRALKGSAIRLARKLSGLRARPKAPVLSGSVSDILTRHEGLCRKLLMLLPENYPLVDTIACEAGPGDCLATAATVLALGAKKVDLVELQPPVLNAKQREVIDALSQKGIPVDTNILWQGDSVQLNPEKVSYHTGFMDDYVAPERYSLVYSFCVLEHVEDIEQFFKSCYDATQPGGINIHMIDLGGHGQFEDPTPPLDFQTYPDWLYSMMYPKFERATRRFLHEYLQVLKSKGFEIEKVHYLRNAEPEYLAKIFPKLRSAARAVPVEELAVIEFAVVARKPASTAGTN